MNQETVALMPTHIRACLQPGKTGEILLVTSGAIYLGFDEQVLLLCHEDWGELPIGIGMADFDAAVCLLRPRQGQQVAVAEDWLIFPAGSVRLILQDAPDCTAKRYCPDIFRIHRAAEELATLRKERGISRLVEPLVLGRQPEQPLQENPHCAYGHQYFSRLISALDCDNPDEICCCVEKLLGLGPGLTPSADDCLLGMLYVFGKLPQKAPAGAELFRTCIAENCDRCTNRISAAYLKAIIKGAPFERMESVFRGLCGAEPLEIQKLTQIGSSSGSEMLLGMLIALGLCGWDVRQKEELQ